MKIERYISIIYIFLDGSPIFMEIYLKFHVIRSLWRKFSLFSFIYLYLGRYFAISTLNFGYLYGDWRLVLGAFFFNCLYSKSSHTLTCYPMLKSSTGDLFCNPTSLPHSSAWILLLRVIHIFSPLSLSLSVISIHVLACTLLYVSCYTDTNLCTLRPTHSYIFTPLIHSHTYTYILLLINNQLVFI